MLLLRRREVLEDEQPLVAAEQLKVLLDPGLLRGGLVHGIDHQEMAVRVVERVVIRPQVAAIVGGPAVVRVVIADDAEDRHGRAVHPGHVAVVVGQVAAHVGQVSGRQDERRRALQGRDLRKGFGEEGGRAAGPDVNVGDLGEVERADLLGGGKREVEQRLRRIRPDRLVPAAGLGVSAGQADVEQPGAPRRVGQRVAAIHRRQLQVDGVRDAHTGDPRLARILQAVRVQVCKHPPGDGAFPTPALEEGHRRKPASLGLPGIPEDVAHQARRLSLRLGIADIAGLVWGQREKQHSAPAPARLHDAGQRGIQGIVPREHSHLLESDQALPGGGPSHLGGVRPALEIRVGDRLGTREQRMAGLNTEDLVEVRIPANHLRRRPEPTLLGHGLIGLGQHDHRPAFVHELFQG